MNNVMANYFRKQQDLAHQLWACVKNIVAMRDPQTNEKLVSDYRTCMMQITQVANFIDEAFEVENSPEGGLKEQYLEVKELWKTVLDNRKVLAEAVVALKDLQYNAETLANLHQDPS